MKNTLLTAALCAAPLLLSGCISEKEAVGLIYGTDPGYDRQLIEGRGNAPWVIRGNLDEQPRMLSFALAPQLWAAYDSSDAALYQVWRGDIEFVGSAYDYRHGPQPSSRGDYYWRRDKRGDDSWQLSLAGEALPTELRYLGHRYLDKQRSAELRFELSSGDKKATVSERPELADDGSALERHIRVEGEYAVQYGDRLLPPGEHVLSVPLAGTRPIARSEDNAVSASEGNLAYGKQVIANSDCLGCHNELHQVVGPAYARIGKKFRGKFQEEPVNSLAHSIIHGSVGLWGEVPMPPHPDMPEEDARAAALYILSLADLEADEDIPLDAAGQPYPATREYDVGPRLKKLHPAFTLESVLPRGFEPKVGGMDFRSDGKLLVASWDLDGAVFLVDPEAKTAKRIAEGLQEPLGLSVVDDRVFVLQKQEVTELVDIDGDGIMDDYRKFSADWPTTPNFHSFAFGLVHRGDALYGALSICVLPGGASCPDQQPSQGKIIRVALEDGAVDYIASGFRTPNGIGLGPDGALYVTDNQGDWLPASKLARIEEGNFYGSRAVPDPGVMSAVETPPVVWMPQDEIGNSPTQPALLRDGPYAGQLIYGDVYHGGIKRVSLEEVAGQMQGALYRFSAGFQGGVNRIDYGPDGAIYLGEIGNPPNWGELGKAWHGLERMRYRGSPAFEILEVRATHKGLDVELTSPLAGAIEPSALSARQWFYYPTEQYGGPKYNEQVLEVSELALSDDGRTLSATIPGLQAGYVVYLALDQGIRAADGAKLWASEAWYTLNAIPAKSTP